MTRGGPASVSGIMPDQRPRRGRIPLGGALDPADLAPVPVDEDRGRQATDAESARELGRGVMGPREVLEAVLLEESGDHGGIAILREGQDRQPLPAQGGL